MKKIKLNNKKYLYIAISLIIFTPAIVYAINTVSSGFNINSGATTKIDAHGVCKNVKNNNGNSIFVPTNTSEEWSYFRSYAPNVGLSDCCTASSISVSGGASFDEMRIYMVGSGNSLKVYSNNWWGDDLEGTLTVDGATFSGTMWIYHYELDGHGVNFSYVYGKGNYLSSSIDSRTINISGRSVSGTIKLMTDGSQIYTHLSGVNNTIKCRAEDGYSLDTTTYLTFGC